MSMFDADAENAALAPPRFKAGGCVYVGRVLSRDEMRPHVAVFGGGDATEEQRELAEVRLIRLVYGRGWWRFWRPSLTQAVLKLPPSTLYKFRVDFFAFLERMTLAEPKTPKSSGQS